jgi:formamidopyrimidine-DNA glycosylase
MLFRFSGDNWLGIHLGMTGKIRVESVNYRPGKHDHLVLFQCGRALVFTDSRQFGRVRFHHGPHEPDWWKSETPEIDSREFDQTFVDQFLDRHRKAPIKAVLLMQYGFPGIGNWMADEILWRARVLPSKRTGKLTARERAAIFRATKFVLRSTAQLVDPSKMETRRHLSNPSYAFAPRYRRWPHHRVVSKMSELRPFEISPS